MGPGESHAGITVPEGDPEALRELARTFGATAKGLGEAAHTFGALPGELSDWRGPASVAFAATAAESSSAAQAAMGAFALKERAAEAASEELQSAQEDAREAIEEAKDAERRIDAARTDMEAARAQGDAALERAAAADVVSKTSDLFGPMAMQALADRQQAIGEAEAAGERERQAKRRLHRAEGDLDQAQRRATRIDQRAEELSDDLSRTLAAAAPANVLASLGGPAVGVGGALAPSPLAALGADGGLRPLLPLGDLRAGAQGRAGRGPSPFGPLAPLLALSPFDATSKALGGASGGLGRYAETAGKRNKMLRSFHSRGLGSLGDPEFSRRLLSPEALAQQTRMRGYHRDELAKAQDARDDISKAKAAGKWLGPLGDAIGAKANADEGMPPLENFMRTGGSWAGGAGGATLAGGACAPGGPVAAGACGAGGAVAGGEFGDWFGGVTYDGLDWSYQNGIEPVGKTIGKEVEDELRRVAEGLGKIGSPLP